MKTETKNVDINKSPRDQYLPLTNQYRPPSDHVLDQRHKPSQSF